MKTNQQHEVPFCILTPFFHTTQGAEDGQKSLVETLKAVLSAQSEENNEEETVEDQDQQFAETLSSHGSMCLLAKVSFFPSAFVNSPRIVFMLFLHGTH